ncbi:MAG: hypothetical protein Q8N63_07385 [Nanoarchaeota archaeon]|nr:hypothetical protein [Nanoarchaeota archaeon]
MSVVERGYEIFSRRGLGGAFGRNYHFRQGIHGEISSVGVTFHITVDGNDSLEEQVKEVIHELAHIGKEFDEKTGRLRGDYRGAPTPQFMDEELPPEVRREIDEESKRFYEGGSQLIDLIRKWLQELH